MDKKHEDHEISDCQECFGKGWNDNWRDISGHYMGGEVFREKCESCQGTGKIPAGAA